MRRAVRDSLPWWTVWAAGSIVVLAGAAAYADSFGGPFVFDDVESIIDNPTIRRLLPLSRVLSPPAADGLTVNGRPLLNLSLAINYALSGTEAWSYHALNLAIHLMAGLLLLGVVRRTLERPGLLDAFGAQACATVAALLFVVHPLQTMAVTYVIQRAESLASMLSLLTLYCFARAVQSQRAAMWLAGAVLACFGAMATKESVAALPLLVLLYDSVFCAADVRAALRKRAGFYAALASSWLLLGYLVLGSHGRGASVGFTGGISWFSYPLMQVGAVVHYLRLAIWPDPLVFDYGEGIAKPSFALVAPALVLAALLAGTLIAMKREPRLGFVGACFFAILAPSSSVVPIVTEPMAEHRMYLPLAALLALATAAMYRWLGTRGLALLLALVPLFGWLTFTRNQDYRDALTLWQDTLDKRPDNTRARENFADALSDAGQFQQAIAQYREVMRANPGMVEAYSRMGVALFSLGRVDEASVELRKALALSPSDSIANYNLGNVFLRRKQPDQAIPYYERALAARPDYAWALVNLANAYFAQGRVDEAVLRYRAAAELEPDAAWIHSNLANALLRLGRLDDAITHYRSAVALDPASPQLAQKLAAALARKQH